MNDYKFLELEHSSFRDHSSTVFYYNEMILRRVKKKLKKIKIIFYIQKKIRFIF